MLIGVDRQSDIVGLNELDYTRIRERQLFHLTARPAPAGCHTHQQQFTITSRLIGGLAIGHFPINRRCIFESSIILCLGG